MTTAKERIKKGHYEVQEVPYGKVYKWVPGHALVEDADAAVEGLEGKKPLVEEEVYYPEVRAYEEWRTEEEAHPYLKHYEWLELQALE